MFELSVQLSVGESLRLVFTAGQIALDPVTMEVVPGGVAEQTERVFLNLRAVLDWIRSVPQSRLRFPDGKPATAEAIWGALFPEHATKLNALLNPPMPVKIVEWEEDE